MKEIVNRLHERRQIELAKSIMEAAGYKVTKRLKESAEYPCSEVIPNDEAIYTAQRILERPAEYGYEDYPEYLEIERFILDTLKKNKSAMIFSDLYPVDYEFGEELFDTGNDYLRKGYIDYEDEDTEEVTRYSGYIFGNRDGMMNLLYIPENKTTNESDRVQGIADYGTKTANEFSDIQDKDPRLEELVRELGLEDVIWPEDEDQEVPDEAYKKVLRAYRAEKSKKVTEAEGVKVNKDDDYLASDEDIAESLEYLKEKMTPISTLLDNYGGIELFRQERGGTEELDIPCKMLGGDYDSVYVISEDDEDGREVLEIFHDMERTEVKKEYSPDLGVCILVEVPGMGQFVYESQWGYISLFKKF